MEETTGTEALRCKRAASGGSVSTQAAARVNAEQASKSTMRRPPRRCFGKAASDRER